MMAASRVNIKTLAAVWGGRNEVNCSLIAALDMNVQIRRTGLCVDFLLCRLWEIENAFCLSSLCDACRCFVVILDIKASVWIQFVQSVLQFLPYSLCLS